jgi:peroxiredoxin
MKTKSTHWTATLAIILFLSFASLQLSAQNVGEAGPDFEVTLLGGETFKLSEQEGKVVFVFFFGNNCPSCKAVAPNIESEIYQGFMDNEQFVAVGLDTWNSSSSVSTVTAFKNSTGVSFPLAINAGDVATSYGSTYDRLMVIDSEGILVHKGAIGAKNDIDNAVEAISENLTSTSLRKRSAAHENLKVYPVPASDRLHFEHADGISSVELFDVTGRLVRELHFDSGASTGKQAISLEGLRPGAYFYGLDTGAGRVSGKFLIR